MSTEWRTIVRWLDVVTGERGEFEDTSAIPHATLIQMLTAGVRVQLNGREAVGGRPLVDLTAHTLEYHVELFPLPDGKP